MMRNPQRFVENPSIAISPDSSTELPSVISTSYISNIVQRESHRHATTIDMLPDNVLLEIFDFYRKKHLEKPEFYGFIRIIPTKHEKWYLLAQVCQRWRQVVFASPHRLNLHILCTYRTPVRKNLGIWPAFPIVIDYHHYERHEALNQEENVLAALDSENLGRVCSVRLVANNSRLRKIVMAMQEPFPVLTKLDIHAERIDALVLPAKFLGGCAPRLQDLSLTGIPFPSLPTLLLSATDLINLYIYRTPSTGYISPEAMVMALGALPRLERFVIDELPIPIPDRIRSPPIKRTVLPALTYLQLGSETPYLEDFVAQIDAPQLDQIWIDHFSPLDFQLTQFAKFIDRSVGPKLTPHGHARSRFYGAGVSFDTSRPADSPLGARRPDTTVISCSPGDWEVSHIAQVLGYFPAAVFNAVHLKLETEDDPFQIKSTDNIEWLHLLHQFSAVQTLHVSGEFVGHVILALEGITEEMAAGLLPSLNSIYLDDQAPSLEKFIALRRLSGRPVTVIGTKTEFHEKLKSYVGE